MTPSPGRARQQAVFVGGVSGRRPRVPVAAEALEAAARRALSPAAFAYLAGGAGMERTMDANRAAFDRHRLVPRVLRGTATRDLTTDLFGLTLPAPILAAPIGVLCLAHADADLAIARACAARGIPLTISSQASVPMERIAAAMDAVQPGAPRLFQLYWNTDDAVTASFVRRAEAIGCAAIVLTLDTTLLGWRPRDLDLAALPFLHGRGIANYTSDPVFLDRLADPLPAAADAPRPRVTLSALRALVAMRRRTGLPVAAARRAVARFVATYSRPALSWDDVSRLVGMTRLPVVLKGILHPDDAREAVARGAGGLVVSTHGGRQVDRSIAALDALPGIVAAVAGRIPVLFDSGIRTGADVAVALALGASAVGIGRPYAYGMALGGADGAGEVLDNLVAEFDLTLGLCGLASVGELGPEALAG